jgi:hypothetical protein
MGRRVFKNFQCPLLMVKLVGAFFTLLKGRGMKKTN